MRMCAHVCLLASTYVCLLFASSYACLSVFWSHSICILYNIIVLTNLLAPLVSLRPSIGRPLSLVKRNRKYNRPIYLAPNNLYLGFLSMHESVDSAKTNMAAF